MKTLALGFLGGGNMAEALIRGLIERRVYEPDTIVVCDPDAARRKHLHAAYGVGVSERGEEVASASRTLVVAVKPQKLDDVLRSIEAVLDTETCLVSVVAGARLQALEARVPAMVPVVRTMPNTPCLVGAGVTALVAGTHATAAHVGEATKMFEAVGRVVNVKPAMESQMDVITGVSGSGPGYVFLFMEALRDAAIALGLDAATAGMLATETVYGSGQLWRATGENPEVLRARVTSPGGTTEAGLRVLQNGRFADLVRSAVTEASQRAKELGDEVASA